MIVLSVGRHPVFCSSRMPILTGALAAGWSDIRTVFRQKSTGKRKRPPGKEFRPEIAATVIGANMNGAFSAG
ncbi:hypothetical protein [Ensifer adhaerens]|uniref:hypothetical protein n=1 Tax=Ensifer adhaerens TaxID=106592 RepID=UPI00128EC582|nr:hypothetical protein [Ensifer adhaerens]